MILFRGETKQRQLEVAFAVLRGVTGPLVAAGFAQDGNDLFPKADRIRPGDAGHLNGDFSQSALLLNSNGCFAVLQWSDLTGFGHSHNVGWLGCECRLCCQVASAFRIRHLKLQSIELSSHYRGRRADPDLTSRSQCGHRGQGDRCVSQQQGSHRVHHGHGRTERGGKEW